MMKRCFILTAVLVLALTTTGFSVFAQEAVTVKGTIESVEADGSSITVNGIKILTSKQLVEDNFLIKGDDVEVSVKKTEKGMEAIDCRFPYKDGSQDDE